MNLTLNSNTPVELRTIFVVNLLANWRSAKLCIFRVDCIVANNGSAERKLYFDGNEFIFFNWKKTSVNAISVFIRKYFRPTDSHPHCFHLCIRIHTNETILSVSCGTTSSGSCFVMGRARLERCLTRKELKIKWKIAFIWFDSRNYFDSKLKWYSNQLINIMYLLFVYLMIVALNLILKNSYGTLLFQLCLCVDCWRIYHNLLQRYIWWWCSTWIGVRMCSSTFSYDQRVIQNVNEKHWIHSEITNRFGFHRMI